MTDLPAVPAERCLRVAHRPVWPAEPPKPGRDLGVIEGRVVAAVIANDLDLAGITPVAGSDGNSPRLDHRTTGMAGLTWRGMHGGQCAALGNVLANGPIGEVPGNSLLSKDTDINAWYLTLIGGDAPQRQTPPHAYMGCCGYISGYIIQTTRRYVRKR
jgi:hypothetical protein